MILLTELVTWCINEINI